jgi:hypothetical protein
MNRGSTPSVSVKEVVLTCGAVCTNEDVLDLLALFWTWMPPRRLLSYVAPLHEEQWSRAASRCCCPLHSLRKADGVVLLAYELVRTERTHALDARTTSLLTCLHMIRERTHARRWFSRSSSAAMEVAPEYRTPSRRRNRGDTAKIRAHTQLRRTLPCNSTQCHAKPRALQKLHAWEGTSEEPRRYGKDTRPYAAAPHTAMQLDTVPCKTTSSSKITRLRGIEPWTSCLRPRRGYQSSYGSLLYRWCPQS